MPTINPNIEAAMTILEAALRADLGLLVRTPDPARARQILYQARTQACNPALSALQIRVWAPEPGCLAIVKGPGRPRSRAPAAGAADSVINSLD